MRKSLVLLLILLFFLPQLASPLKHQMESRLSTQLGGEVRIEKVRFNWLAPQRCHHVVWTDKASGITLSAETITLKENLFTCLRYQNEPVHLRLDGAVIDTEGNFRFIRKFRKKPLHLTFSPIEVTIENRILSFEDLLMQINEKMQVSSRGKIDLGKNQMDLVLGLNGELLKKVFKEARKLPEDFVLEIPISTELSGKAIEKALLGYFLKNYAKLTSLQR